MSANTLWKVRVRKSYVTEVKVSAVTEEEAVEIARRMEDVMFVEGIEWLDPYEEKNETD